MRNVNTALSFIHHQSVGTKLYSQSPPPLHGLHFLYFISTRKCDISLVLICLGAERNGDEVMYQAATRVDALKHTSRNVQLRELFPAVSIQTCLCLLNSAFSALAQSFARCGNADILRKNEGGGGSRKLGITQKFFVDYSPGLSTELLHGILGVFQLVCVCID